ncbi:hypothetical protein [Halobacteriovorax sp. JY17]|uniref:hypothetical protein n=1 Tax=Halobacteriovorax sp. JY17 TaxID=2014617 RepID=UPI000C3943AE|nr:hypothetical protein [Halobacteriovorax sp. JY17]PIK14398.1 MAG: hypothetical protein CES88_08630 [Halobacteriovorax sp. JY17]
MIDFDKFLGKYVKVKVRNLHQVMDDYGVLTKIDADTIELEEEGPSAVNEYGDNMGGTHTIQKTFVISIEEVNDDLEV